MELRMRLSHPLPGKDILFSFNMSCERNIHEKVPFEWVCHRFELENYFHYTPGKIEEVIVAEGLRTYRNTARKMYFFKTPVWLCDEGAPTISIRLEHKKVYEEITLEVSSLLPVYGPLKMEEFMALFLKNLWVFGSCTVK